MGNYANLSSLFTAIANAIRAKTQKTDTIQAKNFPEAIAEIQTGMDTSDATATAENVESGKTFYANGVKKTGSLSVTAGLVDSAVTVVD